MIKGSFRTWLLWILVGGAVFLGLWRIRPFVIQHIPLGYDPGLYRVMIEQYTSLLPGWELTELSPWIQQAYPPFLGMVTSLLSFIGFSPDGLLTRGTAFLSLMIGGALYFFLKQTTKNNIIALFGLLLYLTSFVQRYVFWWGYIKQLVAMLLLLLILGLFVSRRWWMSLPLIVALALLHRAGILYLGLIVIVYIIRHVGIHIKKHRQAQYKKGNTKSMFSIMQSKGIVSLLLLGGGALAVALPIYRPLLELQFGSWGSILVQSLDTPNYSDVYQTSGSFLTTRDLLQTNWWVLLGGILGILLLFLRRKFTSLFSDKRGEISRLVLAWGIGTIWVFGQGFFFQRMIGYADLFWLAGTAVMLGVLRSHAWRGRLIVFLFMIGHSWSYVTRSQKLWRPLIEPSEFAFVQQMSSMTPSDALIVVPGITYSPWVVGWSGREVIAPGLFDLNQRGTVEQERTQKRWQANTKMKCSALSESYSLFQRPLYLREGSKEAWVDGELIGSNIESGFCFTLLEKGDSPDWSFWYIDLYRTSLEARIFGYTALRYKQLI